MFRTFPVIYNRQRQQSRRLQTKNHNKANEKGVKVLHHDHHLEWVGNQRAGQNIIPYHKVNRGTVWKSPESDQTLLEQPLLHIDSKKHISAKLGK